MVQHAQDLDLSGDGVMHEGEWSTRLGVPGIPGAAEDVMVARDLLLVEVTGGRYHVRTPRPRAASSWSATASGAASTSPAR